MRNDRMRNGLRINTVVMLKQIKFHFDSVMRSCSHIRLLWQTRKQIIKFYNNLSSSNTQKEIIVEPVHPSFSSDLSPTLQSHLKDPIVLTHLELEGQIVAPYEHSSTSERENTGMLSNKMILLIVYFVNWNRSCISFIGRRSIFFFFFVAAYDPASNYTLV